MRKSIVVFMVVFALLAVAQPQQQPATAGQPAAQQKTIKDPAEYNAYVNAMKTADPNQKAIELEGFLQQYPNSVMKEDALELLMGAYQANNIPKMVDTAKRILQVNPNSLKALGVLTYIDSDAAQKAPAGDQKTQLMAEAAKYGQQGLGALQTATKPEGVPDAEWQKLKDTFAPIFRAAVVQNALATKDYATAQKMLQTAVDANPNDMASSYQLANAYLDATPQNPLGLWYMARAVALAPQQAPAQAQQITKYGRSRYYKYHGIDEAGWNQLVQEATASPAPPAGFSVKPAPTLAEQAASLVQSTPVKDMGFGEFQLILTSGNQQASTQLWDQIKDKPIAFEATVISATPTTLKLAATVDDIDKKVADVEVTMAKPLLARSVPKEGQSIQLQATAASYTPSPFLVSMNKGELVGKSAVAESAPARKPAAAKTGAHKKTD